MGVTLAIDMSCLAVLLRDNPSVASSVGCRHMHNGNRDDDHQLDVSGRPHHT